MKKTVMTVMACLLTVSQLTAQNTPVSQMEKLDRGVVALPSASNKGNFVSWRMLGTDNEDLVTFDVIRDGVTISKDQYATCYQDLTGAKGATYQVVTKVNGEVVETSAEVKAWEQVYNPIKLDRPATGAQGGNYSPNDMSVGDVDGDGQYELFVKWDPSTSKDNSQGGITDNVFIDCYRLDGTKLWRIDLGRNIRAGAHYTQFMVYDFDGDGRVEMMCKTGPGSLDGKAHPVNQVATEETIKSVNANAVYRSGDGRITGGQEWLTVFKGETGEAVHTVFYNPNRNMTYGGAADGSVNWGVGGKNDTGSYGNRGERFLAGVAFLDGPDKPASGIFCRGYYDYAFIWAVTFDGEQIHQKWLSQHKAGSSYTLYTYKEDGSRTSKAYTGCKATSGSGSGTMYQNGNHNMSIADVDGDGCDEIVWGSAALDNDGRLLYGTGFGHGDAIHLADHNPDRPGLEVFQIHEGGKYGWDLHDAATGEILFSATGGGDNGRGMAAQLDASHRGSYFSSANDRQQRSAVTGNVASTGSTSMNFRIYWDGDLQDELLDGNQIDKWNGNGTSRLFINGKNPYDYNSSQTCNSTKKTPCLQADILGDWREEIILWSGTDNATINIFTTNTPSNYRMPTLMHDHTYRMGICWQNVAYNQPPHLGYYLPDAMMPRLLNEEKTVEGLLGQEMTFTSGWRYASSVSFLACYLPDGSRTYSDPEGFERTKAEDGKSLTVKGTPTVAGDYRFVVRLAGMNKEVLNDTIVFHVVDPTSIRDIESSTVRESVFDLQGRPLEGQPRQGVYVTNGRKRLVK